MLSDFIAYRKAKEFHWGCRKLRLMPFLQDQLFRASSGVVLNLAEGSGKRTPPDQRRFYGMALGSLRECQAILDLEQVQDPALRQAADELGAILFKLSNHPKPKLKLELNRN